MNSGLDNKIKDAVGIEIEVADKVEHALPGEVDIMRISEVHEKEGHLGIPFIVLPKEGVFALFVVDLRVDSCKTSIRGSGLDQSCPLDHPIR